MKVTSGTTDGICWIEVHEMNHSEQINLEGLIKSFNTVFYPWYMVGDNYLVYMKGWITSTGDDGESKEWEPYNFREFWKRLQNKTQD